MAVPKGNVVLPRNEGPKAVMFDGKVSPRSGPAKTVMFHGKVEPIHRKDEATKEDVRWYTGNEYFFMRRRATNLAKRLEECDDDDGEDCSRGLEIVESTAIQERYLKVQRLVHTVVAKHKQAADPEAIAELSRKASQDSIQESIRLAKNDAKHAKKILSETRKEWHGKEKLSTINRIKRLFKRRKKNKK
ncbi:unnamed protein product [Cylindrotheca closterium]|uniref:Uncharacterized protein n=1 Tax=Cylindrotheca closterium TaxID=2856 RepID=A0AAD2G5T4_9STRA|nr:unnamed protein product [Cylindrotheca closterium]